MRGHRAGGWEHQINFVLEKLIELNWKDKWILIYQKFNEALLQIAKDNASNKWHFPKSALVFMEKIDDNTIQQDNTSCSRPKKAIHSWEQGLGENGEG